MAWFPVYPYTIEDLQQKCRISSCGFSGFLAGTHVLQQNVASDSVTSPIQTIKWKTFIKFEKIIHFS